MTNDMAMTSTAADADALDRLREAITELVGRAGVLHADVLRAAGPGGDVFDAARRAVVDFTEHRLRPWQAAAEQSLYRAGLGGDRTRLLVEGLVGEDRMIEQACTRLTRAAADRTRIVADASALHALLVARFGKISDLLLPALAADPGVPLDRIAAILLAAPADGCPGGPCVCGESAPGTPELADTPELDVREVPHAIRHATVFGVFDALAPGTSMILVAHHDPIPLLRQLADRSDGRLDVDYLDRGPEVWRLELTRL